MCFTTITGRGGEGRGGGVDCISPTYRAKCSFYQYTNLLVVIRSTVISKFKFSSFIFFGGPVGP